MTDFTEVDLFLNKNRSVAGIHLQLVHTADTDKTKLSCLVRVGGVNKLIYSLHCVSKKFPPLNPL